MVLLSFDLFSDGFCVVASVNPRLTLSFFLSFLLAFIFYIVILVIIPGYTKIFFQPTWDKIRKMIYNKKQNMRHLILFENYFNTINESVETMKSGVKLFIDEKETKISPDEMIAGLNKGKAFIQFFNQKNGKIVTLTFSNDTKASYRTERGYKTKTVKEGGIEVKDVGIIYSSYSAKFEKEEDKGDIVTVPYQGKSDADFSAALSSFLTGSGGFQNFDRAKMAVNTIYEIGKTKTKDVQSLESLKGAYNHLQRAIKLPEVNIIAGTDEAERTLNKKLKSSLKDFAAKLA